MVFLHFHLYVPSSGLCITSQVTNLLFVRFFCLLYSPPQTHPPCDPRELPSLKWKADDVILPKAMIPCHPPDEVQTAIMAPLLIVLHVSYAWQIFFFFLAWQILTHYIFCFCEAFPGHPTLGILFEFTPSWMQMVSYVTWTSCFWAICLSYSAMDNLRPGTRPFSFL